MSNCDSNLCNIVCEERVEWSFIPPRAPNHGSLWETGVKAVKYHLRRVMGYLRFTYKEFLTTLNQIEGVLNSRPLYPLRVTLTILTP
ncbi:integrase catalytic domain-containing protein [Trichonephila clavipes]|nr:integrase catalytic domain-containing protein [Trichonephila clavipes]